MATIKAYTDLSQSKKLAEILPLESSDMCWTNHCYGNLRSSMTVSSKTIEEYKELLKRFADLTDIDVFYPCWSLAALLDVIPKDESIDCILETIDADNPIDACVAMIGKLHELKIL